MKKLCVLFSFAVLLAGCNGGPDFTPEEQAAVDAATVFFLDVEKADWEAACQGATASYTEGASNISQIIASLTPNGIEKQRARKAPCPESMKRLVEAQTPSATRDSMTEPKPVRAEVSGPKAKVTMEVSNSSFFGNRSGQGSSETVFLMVEEKGSWKFSGTELTESEAAKAEADLPLVEQK